VLLGKVDGTRITGECLLSSGTAGMALYIFPSVEGLFQVRFEDHRSFDLENSKETNGLLSIQFSRMM
jgi:hypothetical protein